MHQTRAPDIATREEVLETFTHLLRGEKSAEQLKAADALAKYHGLFTPREEESACSPEILRAIEDTLADMQRKEGKING